MKSYQILELIGLALALGSAGWELFFTTQIDSIEADIRWSALNYKLDQLHQRQSALQQHIDFKVGEITSGHPAHGVSLSPSWNPSPHEEDLKRVGRQAELLRTIKLTLFVIGTFLLVAAKFMEYSSSAKREESVPSSVPAISAPKGV